MSFYDNSPELVDDIPPATTYQVEQEAEQKPAAQTEQKAQSPLQKIDAPAEPEHKSAQPTEQSELSEAVQQLRADPARRMFTADKLYPDIVIAVAADDANPEIRQLAATTNREYREILADMECSNEEARELTNMLSAAERTPPTDAQKAQWAQLTYAQLYAEYGSKYREAINDAAQLAQRDPRVWAMIVKSNLDTFPGMVNWLVKKAADQKSKGRLPREKKGGDK